MEVERLIEGIKLGDTITNMGTDSSVVGLYNTVEYLLTYTLPSDEVVEELREMGRTLNTHIDNDLLMTEVDRDTLFDRLFELSRKSKIDFLKSRPALIVGADSEDTANIVSKVYELDNGKILVANSLIGKRVLELYVELNSITSLVRCYNRVIAEHKIVTELSDAAGDTVLYRFHYDEYGSNLLNKIITETEQLRSNDKLTKDVLTVEARVVRNMLDVTSVISILDTLYIDMVDELVDEDNIHYLINVLLPIKRELHNAVNRVAVIGSEIVDSVEKLKKHLPDEIDIPEE